MPASTTSRRVRKGKSVASPPKRRKTRVPRRPAAPAADVLLIAQFADVLGQRATKPSRGSRRSLSAALQETKFGPYDGVLAAMPGALVSHELQSVGADGREAMPPCAAVHRRHRLRALGTQAVSWCLAVVVTMGIVAVAAAGLVGDGPPYADTHVTTASAAQF